MTYKLHTVLMSGIYCCVCPGCGEDRGVIVPGECTCQGRARCPSCARCRVHCICPRTYQPLGKPHKRGK